MKLTENQPECTGIKQDKTVFPVCLLVCVIILAITDISSSPLVNGSPGGHPYIPQLDLLPLEVQNEQSSISGSSVT